MRLYGAISLALLLGSTGLANAQDLEDFKPKPKTVKVELDARTVIIKDKEHDTQHLQFAVTVKNREFFSRVKGLTLQLLVFGEYKVKDQPNIQRMLLNQSTSMDLGKKQNLTWKSDIIESGKGRTKHSNYGVNYIGHLAMLTDKEGNEVDCISTMLPYYSRYDTIKKVPTGQDFPNPFKPLY